MHAFKSFWYLRSKRMFDLSHASMIKVQYSFKLCNPLYLKFPNISNDLKKF